MAQKRLGALLLEGGIVDEQALERCLSIQALTGGTRPIGRVLVEQGLLDEATLDKLLEMQEARCANRAADVAASDLASASIVSAAVANDASEVVVSEGRRVRIRVGSGWQELTDEALSGPEVWDFVRETMGSDVLETLAEQHFVVRPWRLGDGRHGTATAFRQFDGVAVRLTFAPTGVAEPGDIGVPQQVVDAVDAGKGLVLCVGERGVGRGSMLASLTARAARDEAHYVVVVDDEPIGLPEHGALVVQRRYGIDPASRSAVLRSVVQEDPDVLVVADVGSPQAFELALRAAEGGRLVIAYLDAQNVCAALSRILNFYPSFELPRVRSSLAAVLRTVLVRHQLPAVDGRGTVPATELLVVGEAAREIIRTGDLAEIALLLRADDGSSGHSLDRSMLELLDKGQVYMADVFTRAEEKAWLLEHASTTPTQGDD